MINPHPIDVYVGERLRQARKLRNISQSKLGRMLTNPITFQQIQKYELASNRIALSRLYEMAKVLQLPLAYFLPERENEMLPVMSEHEHFMLECFRKMPGRCQQSFIMLFMALMEK